MDQKAIKKLEKLLQKALVNVATKDDLKQLKADLIEEIKESEGFSIGSADRNKADRSSVEALEKRDTRIERKLTT